MNIETIRNFNRYYTKVLGVFSKNVFDLEYSMIEMRVLGEINRNLSISAKTLAKYLDLDKSYLSRIVNKLSKDGLIQKKKNRRDSRYVHLYLTADGKKLNNYVEEQSNNEVYKIFEHFNDDEILLIEQSFKTIEQILDRIIPIDMEKYT